MPRCAGSLDSAAVQRASLPPSRRPTPQPREASGQPSSVVIDDSRQSVAFTDASSAPADSSRLSGRGSKGSAAPPDELLLALSSPAFVELAEHHHIFWVKLRGYPHWPVCTSAARQPLKHRWQCLPKQMYPPIIVAIWHDKPHATVECVIMPHETCSHACRLAQMRAGPYYHLSSS